MIVLCSGSSTRALLLKKAGIDFIQKSCDFDEETIKSTDPYEFVTLAAYGKFKACKKCFENENIVSADTVVSDGKNILRKAKDINDAKRILLAQSGKEIKIITSMWVRVNKQIFSRLDETIYEFDVFDETDLNEYLTSGEWEGKAGACMVEGFCKKYIKNVKGYESTAMGLCIEELLKIIGGDNAN
ncbi:septum formation protein Maf [Nautilia profundicola AmH]|uniref:Nucleoside triphosphate pyrophosphatase n=1 Tax=Nautilia profundicola (strain ATCC BAA-1463 / DSM 18972 / AmH) TaxID=598659 RepID=B9L7F9_NAUPA|nr:septum formation inhibitor Maf [Nautilia profundicola]ACM93571.1 septum formation protein Maf [Nautilia profundicola AmH]